MARTLPVADLAHTLDRLAGELAGAADLDGTSPAYFQSRLLPILAALADVTKAARLAIEPALLVDAHRASADRGKV